MYGKQNWRVLKRARGRPTTCLSNSRRTLISSNSPLQFLLFVPKTDCKNGVVQVWQHLRGCIIHTVSATISVNCSMKRCKYQVVLPTYEVILHCKHEEQEGFRCFPPCSDKHIILVYNFLFPFAVFSF
jgi:hypothetical protein